MKKLFLLFLFLSNIVFAKDIKIIVPYTAGGSTDKLARIAAEFLSNSEYNFVIDYKLGAGGAIAAAHVSNSDETMLMATSNGLVGAPIFNGVKSYSLSDFVILDYLGTEPLLLLVKNDGKISNFKEFVEAGKTMSMPFGHGGAGTSGYLTASIIAKGNSNFISVPYKGAPNILVDLLAGNIKWAVDSTFSAGELIADKKLLPIAVYSTHRLAQFPNVPTVKELGINDRSMYRWHVLVANKNANQKVIDYVRSRMSDPVVRKEMSNIGVNTTSPKNWNTTFLEDEATKLKQINKDIQ